MTAAEELQQATGTVPGTAECSAMIPVTFNPDDFPALMRCPEPPVAQVEGRCRCGHVREGWLCEEHAGLLAASGCRACLEDESMPHDCPLTVATTGGGS